MDTKRSIIMGSYGQLGMALKELFSGGTFVDRDDFDITNPARYESEDWSKYDRIINAAAFTNVDGAETGEGRVAAWQINATAVGLMADVANKHDLTLVHVSSDYVFDGTRKVHLEDEPFSPLGVYGQTKAAGDIAAARAQKHYILRASWVIGEGKNFVRTMVALAEKGIQPTVVDDQLGRLTFTSDLAGAIAFLLDKNAPYGTYNVTNDGEVVSWAKIAQAVFIGVGKHAADVTPITTADYFRDKPEGSPRPINSALDITKISEIGFQPRKWTTALQDYLREMK